MAQLFISYSRQDIEFARHLRGLLQAVGFEVWMDERLVPSTQWWRMLERQIKASAALIVIMSPASAESRWVEREILVAENNNIPIFPLLLDGPNWSRLADIQYEDFTAGLRAELPPRLVEALRLVMNGTPPERSATRPVRAAPPVTESRLLEAAMPAESRSGGDSEMWAKISLPDSAGLRAELPALVPSGDVIQKSDARTTSFPFRFPTDPRTGERLPVQMTLQASSADFTIRSPGGDEFEIVELPPDTDSRTVIFSLYHKAGGRLSGRARLFLDLIYESRVIAQISVSTQLVEQVSRVQDGASPWALWSVPLGGSRLATGEYRRPDLSGIPAAAVLEETPSGALEDNLERADADAYDAALADDDLEESDAALDEGRWQGALPSQPIRPLAPERPTTKVDEQPPPQESRLGTSEATAASSRSASPPSQRRTSPLAAGASVIAGLALVFVVVVMLVSQNMGQPPALDVQATNMSATQSMALAAEAATNTAIWTASETQAALVEATEVETEPTLTGPSGGSTTARSGIAAARLAGCEGTLEATRLSGLLDELNIGHDLLPGDMVDAIAAQASDPDGAALVFWGSCQGEGAVQLTAELFAPPVLRGLLHPERVALNVPAEMLQDRESIAALYVATITRYMQGRFDVRLLEDLVALESSLPDGLDNRPARMGLLVLIGTTQLVAQENYEAAAQHYGQIDLDSDVSDALVAALNNHGFALLNRAFEMDGVKEPDALTEAVGDAEHLLVTALERANNPPAQHLTIQLNRAMLRILVKSRVEPGRAEEGLEICRDAAANFFLDAEPLVCEVAARLTLLTQFGQNCESPDELAQLADLLDEARAFEPDEPYLYFWQGIVLDHQAECAPGVEEGDGLHARANESFERFLMLMDQGRFHLAIDRAFLAEATARASD